MPPKEAKTAIELSAEEKKKKRRQEKKQLNSVTHEEQAEDKMDTKGKKGMSSEVDKDEKKDEEMSFEEKQSNKLAKVMRSEKEKKNMMSYKEKKPLKSEKNKSLKSERIKPKKAPSNANQDQSKRGNKKAMTPAKPGASPMLQQAKPAMSVEKSMKKKNNLKKLSTKIFRKKPLFVKKTPSVNDIMLKNTLQRFRSKSGPSGMKNKRNEEGYICPDHISSSIDVADEYHQQADSEVSAVETPFNATNNENHGKLFVKGVPFWCLKDEKPPKEHIVSLSHYLDELIANRFKMESETDKPTDLDPFNTLEVMQARDVESNNKMRMVSSAIRSSVMFSESAAKRREEPEMAPTPHGPPAFSIHLPDKVFVYNRKNRMKPPTIQHISVEKNKKKIKNLLGIAT